MSNEKVDRATMIVRFHGPVRVSKAPTADMLNKFFDFIENPRIRENMATLSATVGSVGAGVIIGLAIVGFVAAVVSVKGLIALIVLGTMLFGLALLLTKAIEDGPQEAAKGVA